MEQARVNEREIVLDILTEAEKGVYVTTLLKQVLDKYAYLPRRSRSFIKLLTEGCVERQITLDYMIGELSSVPLKKIKPLILRILRLSLYQIKYMDQVPASAAVNEGVKLARKRGFQGLSGYVNGVLRSAVRTDFDSFPDLSVRYSVPAWIVSLFESQYGGETCEKMLRGSVTKPELYLRCNTAVNTPEELLARLAGEGVEAEAVPAVPGAIRLIRYDSLSELASFQEGCAAVQDLSSQLAGMAASPKAGDRILDLCAAPGGKAIHLACMAGPAGFVTARDLTEKKAELIREGALRMKCANLQVQVKDASVFYQEDEESVDLVMADLPCSGLGVLSRRTDLKYRIRPEDLEGLAELQRQILRNAVRYVKHGGVLIYSTCTVNRGENEEMLPFIESLGMKPDPLDPYLPEAFRGRGGESGHLQLLQGVDGTDGFFISRFIRQ